MKQSVSAFVICFNEEDKIEDCLRSLDFCDEVIVIDSFSTDKTVQIARTCGAHVIERSWPGYRKQKAFGLTQVKHEWVINLDADERISPELRTQIIRVLEGPKKGIVGYEVLRTVYYLNRWWRRGGWYPEYRLRFFQKSHITWGGTDPHEKPVANGKIARLSGEIQHFTYDSLEDQLSRLQHFSTLAAKEVFVSGGKPSLFLLIFNPALRFFKFYILKRGFREGTAGFIIAVAEAYYTFMKYAKLWELYFQKKPKEEGCEHPKRASLGH